MVYQEKKKMKLHNVILILLLTSLLTASAVFSFYQFYLIEDIKELDMDVIVSDHIGFDVGTDALHFGMTMPGATSSRKVTLSHGSEKALKVFIRFSGDLKNWVTSDNDFIIEPGEKREIEFTLHTPSTNPGEYKGKAIITFRKVIFS